MSGIVGIINFDGAPIERALFERMQKAMVYRGPDRVGQYVDDNVALGHHLLFTTPESLNEIQPLSFDQQIWIVADARVDDQARLRDELTAAGHSNLQGCSDVALILHAYQTWGADCVSHLLGDFAFVIWDSVKQSVFCARDHFGVRPFYYLTKGKVFAFASDLDTLRLHPLMSDSINSQVVGDFLLAFDNLDPATTIYADIMRVPAGHSMTITPEKQRESRYWEVPTGKMLRYQRPEDYAEHFYDILVQATFDRLRTTRNLAISLSGGLDSTSLAALAVSALDRDGSLSEVTAFHEEVMEDETLYAEYASETYGIDLRHLPTDLRDAGLYLDWFGPDSRFQQPVDNPWIAYRAGNFRQMAEHSSVGMSGLGGDQLFRGSRVSYFLEMIRHGYVRQAGIDLVHHLIMKGSLRGVRLRTSLLNLIRRAEAEVEPFPAWIEPNFAAEYHLKQRWNDRYEDYWTPNPMSGTDVFLPHADAILSYRDPHWAIVFEHDHSAPGQIEMRHPFFDVRLIDYVLSIPPAPWSQRKFLLRTAMKGKLPEKVRLRGKSSAVRNYLLTVLEKAESLSAVLDTSLQHISGQYISQERFLMAFDQYREGRSPNNQFLFTVPFSLNYWFQRTNVHSK